MKSLTAQESEEMFTLMLTGKMPELDIEDFLVTLRHKGESADEILGAINAIKQHQVPLNFGANYDLIDVCGTGGDGLNTLNISTASAFVLSGCGLKVAKHGNKAVSSKSGSSDVMSSYLGLENIHNFPQKCLEEANYCYLHAPFYHPILKIVAPIRAKIKTRTIFNILGPLLNPLNPKYQLIGVYEEKLLKTFAEILRKQNKKKAWICHGADKMDEVSISDITFVAELDKGAIDIFEVTPADFGFEPQPLEAIAGGDAKHNAAEIVALLDGKKSAYRDIVLMNAAAALLVAEKVQNLQDGVAMAANAIDSGKAKAVLEKLQNLS